MTSNASNFPLRRYAISMYYWYLGNVFDDKLCAAKYCHHYSSNIKKLDSTVLPLGDVTSDL